MRAFAAKFGVKYNKDVRGRRSHVYYHAEISYVSLLERWLFGVFESLVPPCENRPFCLKGCGGGKVRVMSCTDAASPR